MTLKRHRKPTVLHTIGHQTPAVMHHIQSLGGTRGGSTSPHRRRKRSITKSATRVKSRRSRKSNGRLTKGSAAAKAWGRKMKRMRKK